MKTIEVDLSKGCGTCAFFAEAEDACTISNALDRASGYPAPDGCPLRAGEITVKAKP